ncbi:MAG: hypothetical protein KIH64_006310 [Mycobacterium sp.]|nr:hypothetical protein [Mycobacterium sp.]
MTWMTWTTTLPLLLVSVANQREHWSDRARRASRHRGAAVVVPKGLPIPCVVTIERLYGGRGQAMDTDNLQAACKALRDGIADRLGVDDADPRVTWRYAQTRAPEPGVRITVEAA